MVASLAWVEIGVTDLDRSLELYVGALGLRATTVTSEGAWLEAGPVRLRLVAVGPDGTAAGFVRDDLQRGLRHLAFKVGDVDASSRRLLDLGYTFTMEPTNATGGVRIAFFLDPDGTVLELVDGYVRYDRVHTPELAERERFAAAARSPEASASADHVAVTVGSLGDALARYRDRLGWSVIGELDFADDPRGFTISYLQAGAAVLELFSYATPTLDPVIPERALLGLRRLGVEVERDPVVVETLDADGVVLELVPR